MNSVRKLWAGLAALLIASFAVLLWTGWEIHRQAPPMPEQVLTTEGRVVYSRADIEQGRQVWQSIGGQQLGSVWGHGAYVAPDWGAEWLHREAVAIMDIWAEREHGKASHTELDAATQAGFVPRLKEMLRPNTFDAATQTITIHPDRAQAMARVADHYTRLFGDDAAMTSAREQFAMRNNTVANPEYRQSLMAFFWWAAWAQVTERPGHDISYTANWPHEPLVGNTPPASLLIWSVFSVLFLIAGIGLLAWYYAANHKDERAPELPATDPLAGIVVTPSMRATQKYFWVVIALFLVQILLGAVTAHFQVEGHDFYGIPLADYLPYSLTRTWHTQLAVLWIATAWLGMGLYIAPAISGHEPKFQRLGVNFLWVCLIVIVAGSFFGQWLAVMQKLGLDKNFWFGHQGWEYVDIGRFWQAFLFIGLIVWLTLVGRALWPALKAGGDSKPLVTLFFLSVIAIGLFYAAGLLWGERTHMSMVEYWRWWVVHLWVEGFFEVFAVAVMAFLFTRLGLIQARLATVAVLFSTIVFLAGGVLGTLHHLYFAGTPTAVLALGASFSALEVVPLALVGYEAFHHYQLSKSTPWMSKYKWPIYFFIAVSVWNLIGAGLFGFLINPPLSLYYMQGLNLTPLHGHTALFGVYGMLGIGLMLFSLRGLRPQVAWDEKVLKVSFWCFNIGLAGMALLTLLPLGIAQLHAAITHGYWYARSAEFMQQPFVDLLVWMRVPGDTIFSIGALALAWFVLRLWVAPKRLDAERAASADARAEIARRT